MDTKPSYLPEMLAEQLALRSAAHAAGRLVPSNVIAFPRPAAAKESRLSKKLEAMNAAQTAFWTQDRKAEAALRAVLDAVKATKPTIISAIQSERAKKLRPKRKQEHAERDQRIREADKKGTPRKQIAVDQDLSVSQVGKICKEKN